MTKYYLAIDLGATSGRHIVGYYDDKHVLKLDEVHRFKTENDDTQDGLVWDLDRIFDEIVKGISKAIEKYKTIQSLAIDSWAVDYVLLKDNQVLKPFYAYRNSRCDTIIDEVHHLMSFEKIYGKTGIQFAKFNTIYQLFWDKKHGRLDVADGYLMLPEYFTFLLTGKKVHEYTNATSMSLVNLKTKKIDDELVSCLGFKRELFSDFVQPGYLVGELKEDIQKLVGGNIKVVMCASHDTASAFEAVDVSSDTVIISSGTWSLLGVKIKEGNNSLNSMKDNFTNEGGVGYIRYLKNINGMYIFNRYCQEVGVGYIEGAYLASKSNCSLTFDVNDSTLLAPKCMGDSLVNLLNNNLTIGDICRCIFNSIALSYEVTIKQMEKNLSTIFNKICIIGGGAKNQVLNEIIEQYTHKEVIAMPLEATAIGNLQIQMKGE